MNIITFSQSVSFQIFPVLLAFTALVVQETVIPIMCIVKALR